MRRGTRGTGVPINPARVHSARVAAGLTMEELADGAVSRTFIHLLEKGVSRPSPDVLNLIAKRTHKPVNYFTEPGSDDALTRQQLVNELAVLAVRLKRFREDKERRPVQRESIKLLESALRQGAMLLKHL